nr:T9SS type A sorting domain-containing protein [Bacteroidota bacterium]
NCVPALCDIDFDGDLDILCGNISGNLTYFENQSGGWILNPEIFQGISGGQNTTPALADLDDDGDPDLTLGQYNGTLNYFRNQVMVTMIPSQPDQVPSTSMTVGPNPFDIATSIRFKLSTPSAVWLQITDLNGKTVTGQRWEQLPEGSHHWILDTYGIPAGVYIVCLYSDTCPPILIKAVKK